MNLEDPLDRFLVESVMWEKGILPLNFEEHDVGRRLAQFTPEEASQLKRRFRKVWRKLCKGADDFSRRRGENPKRKTKKMRKFAVLYDCMREAWRKKSALSVKTSLHWSCNGGEKFQDL